MKATDYLNRPQTNCALSNCNWFYWDTVNNVCGTTEYTSIVTTDSGDGNNFDTYFPTDSVVTTLDLCMRCDRVTNNMGTLDIEGGKISFMVENCDNYITITQPSTTYSWDVTDTTAGS